MRHPVGSRCCGKKPSAPLGRRAFFERATWRGLHGVSPDLLSRFFVRIHVDHPAKDRRHKSSAGVGAGLRRNFYAFDLWLDGPRVSVRRISTKDLGTLHVTPAKWPARRKHASPAAPMAFSHNTSSQLGGA